MTNCSVIVEAPCCGALAEDVLDQGAGDALEVDAVVFVEARVLDRDHGVLDVGGDLARAEQDLVLVAGQGADRFAGGVEDLAVLRRLVLGEVVDRRQVLGDSGHHPEDHRDQPQHAEPEQDEEDAQLLEARLAAFRPPTRVGGSLAAIVAAHGGSDADLTRNAVDVLPAGRLEEQLAAGRPLRVKLGIDPTTADIHLGHTVVLEKLREFQEAGHTVVLIIGDFTARVGDPSGRSAQRPLPSPEEIEANAATYQEQAFKVLDRERTEVRFNSEWLRMEPEELLGLLAQTTVARLLERDDFQKRLAAGAPIAALELLYPLLQGYDSVAVEADVELGGTDQKFNLLFGRDIQAAYGQKPQSILTMPILVGIDGVAEDEQVARQLRRRHRGAGGDVRQG